MTAWFHAIPGGTALMAFGILNTAWTAVTWWRDCIIEGDMGMHTEIVRKNLISGMWLFIVSEAMLFFGLLWACLHLGMSPSVALQVRAAGGGRKCGPVTARGVNCDPRWVHATRSSGPR